MEKQQFINRKKEFLTSFSDDDFNDMISSGIAECACVHCFGEMSLEPDAFTGYCERCNKVVSVINPLIDTGLI
jgi:hypothetical protein